MKGRDHIFFIQKNRFHDLDENGKYDIVILWHRPPSGRGSVFD
jgi:hypothetical protein